MVIGNRFMITISGEDVLYEDLIDYMLRLNINAQRVSLFYYLNIFPVKTSSPSLRGFYRKIVVERVGSSMTKYLEICGAKILGLSNYTRAMDFEKIVKLNATGI